MSRSQPRLLLVTSTSLFFQIGELTSKMRPYLRCLATAALHHHLIKEGTRTRVSLIVESGEPGKHTNLPVLLGYGASAINPYLAFETITDIISRGLITDIS